MDLDPSSYKRWINQYLIPESGPKLCKLVIILTIKRRPPHGEGTSVCDTNHRQGSHHLPKIIITYRMQTSLIYINIAGLKKNMMKIYNVS